MRWKRCAAHSDSLRACQGLLENLPLAPPPLPLLPSCCCSCLCGCPSCLPTGTRDLEAAAQQWRSMGQCLSAGNAALEVLVPQDGTQNVAATRNDYELVCRPPCRTSGAVRGPWLMRPRVQRKRREKKEERCLSRALHPCRCTPACRSSVPPRIWYVERHNKNTAVCRRWKACYCALLVLSAAPLPLHPCLQEYILEVGNVFVADDGSW